MSKVQKFYDILWYVLKVLLVIAVIGLLIFAKVAVDGVYINWIT